MTAKIIPPQLLFFFFFLELFIINLDIFKNNEFSLETFYCNLIANTDCLTHGMPCINSNFWRYRKVARDRTTSLSFKILHIHVRVITQQVLQWPRQLISICAGTRNELDARISFFFFFRLTYWTSERWIHKVSRKFRAPYQGFIQSRFFTKGNCC